ncbi:MAG: dockerin type I repeat-containing protein, partial [Tepidisphaeraceae bacterium]
VGSYQINGTTLGSDDVARLYINPTSFGDATPPVVPAPGSTILTAPVAGTDLFDTAAGAPAVAAMVLRQGGGVPGVQVDELRVDTSWAQVTPPPGVAWSFDGDGAWSQDGNWSSGLSPNQSSAFVGFPSVGGAPHTVTVDAPIDLRTINLTSPQAYTIAGVEPLNFSDAAAINVFAGSHVVSAPITLGGTFLASVASGSALTTSGALDAEGRAISKAGAGTWQVNRLRADSLSIYGGTVKIAPSGTPEGVNRLTTLAVSPIGKLDLTNNALIVASTPAGTWTGASYTGVSGLAAAGRNGGTWNGSSGIVTSDTRALVGSDFVAIGVARAADALGIASTATAIWSGQTVTGNATLARFTWGGDANLDGKINIDDYGQIDFNVGSSGSVFGWVNGDFNYDGKINIDDYGIIDFNVIAQGAPLMPAIAAATPRVAGTLQDVASVPEPAMLTPLLLTALAARRRRRANPALRG